MKTLTRILVLLVAASFLACSRQDHPPLQVVASVMHINGRDVMVDQMARLFDKGAQWRKDPNNRWAINGTRRNEVTGKSEPFGVLLIVASGHASLEGISKGGSQLVGPELAAARNEFLEAAASAA